MIAYIGAGEHIDPLPGFNFNMVMVDSQPASEFPPYYRKGYSRPWFAKFIRAKSFCAEPLRTPGCCDPNIDMFQPHKCILESGNVYFTSSAFPSRMTEELRTFLGMCDKLLISGFFPSSCIVDYLQKPSTFYLMSGSVYDQTDEDNIINWLWGQSEATIICISKSEIARFTNMKDAYTHLSISPHPHIPHPKLSTSEPSRLRSMSKPKPSMSLK